MFTFLLIWCFSQWRIEFYYNFKTTKMLLCKTIIKWILSQAISCISRSTAACEYRLHRLNHFPYWKLYARTDTFWATVCKTVRPILSERCPVCPVCDVGGLRPNGWTDQDETWHTGRPRPRPHCVGWRSSSPHGKGHINPHILNLRGRRLCLHPYNPRSMSTVAKRLDGSRWNLAWR